MTNERREQLRDKAVECLEEFRKMLDDGYTLVNTTGDVKLGDQVTRVCILIAKSDSILIPLRSLK